MAITPTTAKCGTTGTVSLGGEITKWSFTIEQELLDATSQVASAEDSYKQFIACLKKGSGSFSTLVPCGGVGASAAVVFTNDDHAYTADIIITSIGLTTEVAGVRTFNYTFVTTGAVT
jgi:hypothetical protein